MICVHVRCETDRPASEARGLFVIIQWVQRFLSYFTLPGWSGSHKNRCFVNSKARFGLMIQQGIKSLGRLQFAVCDLRHKRTPNCIQSWQFKKLKNIYIYLYWLYSSQIWICPTALIDPSQTDLNMVNPHENQIKLSLNWLLQCRVWCQ